MNDHLDSIDAELNQSQFFQLFALGCFDSLIILPIGITSLAADIVDEGAQFKFYQGWSLIHSDWAPVLLPKRIWSTLGWNEFSVYWSEWINPFFALVFFTLFGLTPEARKGYRNCFHFLGSPLGVGQTTTSEEGLPEVVFKSGRGTNTADTGSSNVSSRYGSST